MTTNAIHPDLPPADWVSKCGRFVLYRGDCLDVMPKIPKGAVGVIISDPPYGMNHPCNFSERGRGNLAPCNDWSDVAGDAVAFNPEPILAMKKPTILWGGNRFSDKLPPTSGWLVWDKERPDDLDQATCELAWTNCVKGVRRFRHLWHGMMKASERGESYHPTQKPVALFSWILGLRWVLNTGVVWDPYMGCGPCGVACVKTGRRFIGVEIDDHYFNVARKRIEQAITDYNGGPMFENVEPQSLYEGGQQ